MKKKTYNRICHSSILHRLDDSRIFYKECLSLVKAGYNVTLIARAGSKAQFDSSSYCGVNLRKLKSNNRVYNNFYLFLIILRQRVQVVHFHDPELIIIGLLLKLLGKKVIYDVHENVRQDILHKTWLSPALRPLLSKVFVFLELIASAFFNGIVSATPTIAKNFNNKNNYVVRNFPPLNNSCISVKNQGSKNIIIYIGTLSESRGIKELIAAAGHLEGTAELWLLGNWNDESFKLECEKMPGYNNTKYLGIVSHEDVTRILCKATLGICTLHPIDTFKDSYPIKVFEYMQNGLPVLMSDFDTWRDFFKDLCEYTDPLDHVNLAKKVEELLASPVRLGEMATGGRRIINERFNWDSEFNSLLKLYNKI